MAIIKQGILGGFQGKIGAVVGTSWKGIAVVKSKPISVANPRTANQVEQRTKLKNVVSFAGFILATVIKPLWDRFASKASGYNDFVSTNISLFTNELPSSPEGLIISSGKMAATSINTATGGNGDTGITLTWVDDSNEGMKLASDRAYAVIYNERNNEISGLTQEKQRSQGSVQVVVSDPLNVGDILHCYLAFRRSDGTVVSNNSYKTFTVSA